MIHYYLHQLRLLISVRRCINDINVFWQIDRRLRLPLQICCLFDSFIIWISSQISIFQRGWTLVVTDTLFLTRILLVSLFLCVTLLFNFLLRRLSLSIFSSIFFFSYFIFFPCLHTFNSGIYPIIDIRST
ncbi:hypothetical protein HanIR_Chr01g0007131 [Helianthus annuus]|nr:hypothetical protein HanIR_Chr01g0007131 [Helianthus annuus]